MRQQAPGVYEAKSEDHKSANDTDRPANLIWYGGTPAIPPPQLVEETLPQIGIAILGGQFGSAKTFCAADLVAAVMLGGKFAGKALQRKGGVLWLAAEGEDEIEGRVFAAIAARAGNATSPQPFARQAGSVPRLTEKEAPTRLRALADEASAHMKAAFNVTLALIVIDTLSGAAGFEDENSAAETQKVMSMLAGLGRATKALALLIDHHGKDAESGIRGSSAKSAAADAILACFGDRDQATGAVVNRKLAVTKLRAGSTGRVIPFGLEGTEDGRTCVVRWKNADAQAGPTANTEAKGKRWPKSLVIFKEALDEALDAGRMTVPRVGMPEVKVVDQEKVRAEFYKRYLADSPAAKKEAFRRCAKDAVERGIMAALNVGPDLQETIFWLT
jgi:hypothetical protein